MDIAPAFPQAHAGEPQSLPDARLKDVNVVALRAIRGLPRGPAERAVASHGSFKFGPLVPPTPFHEHECTAFQTSPVGGSHLRAVDDEAVETHIRWHLVIPQDRVGRPETSQIFFGLDKAPGLVLDGDDLSRGPERADRRERADSGPNVADPPQIPSREPSGEALNGEAAGDLVAA